MAEVELNDSSETAAEDTLAPPTQKKKRLPPFFITPRANFPLTLNNLRLTAPSLRSQMSNKFLKLAVETEDEHRALSRLLAAQGAEFKTFNLKQDLPFKIVLRGLPACTSLDDVKNEIVKANFDVVSISRLTKFQNKSPMPLVYVQIARELNQSTTTQKCLAPKFLFKVIGGVKARPNVGAAKAFSIPVLDAVCRRNASNALAHIQP
ncbi:hypothetical protein AVEN_61155-1, partial [Araneus ventricosus]